MIPIKPFVVGSKFTGDFVESITRAIIELQKYAVLSVQYPLSFQNNILSSILKEPFFFAWLTDESAGLYGWEEIELASSGDWQAVTDGRSGTVSTDAAKEINSRTGLYDDSSAAEKLVVVMFTIYDVGTGERKYRFITGYTQEREFWAVIGASAEADAPAKNRWKYAWQELEKTATGYGGWSVKAGGRSGSTTVNPAFNTIEDMNTGADGHIEGNGVDPAHLDTATATYAIMPATNGVIVRMHEIIVDDSANTKEYWFSYENGVDGDCD